MKCIGRIRQFTLSTLLLCSTTVPFLTTSPVHAATAPAGQPLAPADMQRLDERMYREGLLPSGEPMQAYVKGDIPAPGTAFTCVSCHMLSGLGSVEGGVFTTPTDGKTLYQPRDKSGTGNNRRNATMSMGSKRTGDQPNVQPPPARPAYTDETLASVLRGGRDPSGRILDLIMPRYNLTDQDMANLIAYLKTLSVDHSPGVDNYGINFATVVSDEVPAEQVEAMMRPIESFVASANKQQVQLEKQQVKLLEIPKDQTYRRVQHTRWVLKGPPDTWRSQLEGYYQKGPVFALIGGLSSKGWQQVHAFSEDHALPCILPITDFPVISGNAQYTLYFSKGYYQEGEAAARYLKSSNSSAKPMKVLQIFSTTAQGTALSEGFLNTSKDDKTYTTVSIPHNDKEPLAQSQVQKLLDKEKPDVLIFWTDSKVVASMKTLANIASSSLMVMVSSSYLGTSVMTIPDELRDMTYITYPYRLPADEKRFARFTDQNLSAEAQKIEGKSYSMLRVLTQALRDLKGDFYRDYLLDLIDMRQDVEYTPYERLSFGPSQRYAVKGCYIVQLTKGSKPELLKKSEWVIH